jgi:carbon-monoxide dehydrogenase iron sulfur subunit
LSKVIVVDVGKCYACLGCVVECACKQAGAGEEVSLATGVLEHAACAVMAVGSEPVPLVCNHCEDAPCLTVCPTTAIHRTSEAGPVLMDEDRCIGCKACVMACPFGMVKLRHNGNTAIKCDLCADRLARGESPSCVEACVTGALELRELDDVVAETRARAGAMLLAGLGRQQ